MHSKNALPTNENAFIYTCVFLPKALLSHHEQKNMSLIEEQCTHI